MGEYLPAALALDELCYAQPDQPYRYGLKKTLLGAGLLVFGGATAVIPFVDLIPGVDINVRGQIADKVADAGCIVLGAGCVIASLYLLPDGIHSLLKPLRNIHKGGHIYAHNGGYTRRTTWADRKYGTRIYPVDSVKELTDLEGCVFVNGFEVLETNITDFRGEAVSVEKTRDNPDKSFSVTLKGKLRGDYMDSSAWLDYLRIQKLIAASLHGNNVLCFAGTTKKGESAIRTDFFHEAFK